MEHYELCNAPLFITLLLTKNIKTNENKLLKLKTEFLGIQNIISKFPNAIELDVLNKEIKYKSLQKLQAFFICFV